MLLIQIKEKQFLQAHLEKLFPKFFKFYNFGLGDIEETKLLNIAIQSYNNYFLKPTKNNYSLYSKVKLSVENIKVNIKSLSALNIEMFSKIIF